MMTSVMGITNPGWQLHAARHGVFGETVPVITCLSSALNTIHRPPYSRVIDSS